MYLKFDVCVEKENEIEGRGTAPRPAGIFTGQKEDMETVEASCFLQSFTRRIIRVKRNGESQSCDADAKPDGDNDGGYGDIPATFRSPIRVLADCAIAKLILARTTEDAARAVKTTVAIELVAEPLSHTKKTKKCNYVGNQDAECKNAEYPAQR